MNSPFFPTVVQGRLLQLLLGSAASVFFCLGLQFLLRGEPRPGFWITAHTGACMKTSRFLSFEEGGIFLAWS